MPMPHPARLGRLWRAASIIALDIALVNLSIWLAFMMRFNMAIPEYELLKFAHTWWIATLIHVGVFALFRLYHVLWEYAGADEFFTLCFATAVSMALLLMVGLPPFWFHVNPNYFMLPRTVYPMAMITQLTLSGMLCFGYRMVLRLWRNRRGDMTTSARRVMVVGAGMAGSQVVKAFKDSAYRAGRPVVVVDDDLGKQRATLSGVPVTGPTGRIAELARAYAVDEIIVAIPSADTRAMERILRACTATRAHLKIVKDPQGLGDGGNAAGPSVGGVSVGARGSGAHADGARTGSARTGSILAPQGMVRDVDAGDLLLRGEARIDMDAVGECVRGRCVLVTGGGGSIGSELCRLIATFGPRKLIIFDVYENNAYELLRELELAYPGLPALLLIGSVRDEARMEQVFALHKPDVVFHAAAHKHVPTMEDSAAEAVKNNVGGTWTVAQCAQRHGADRFVLLSTDKAVNPTTVMGASKRVTELLLGHMARRSTTRFMAVRFGNVLGSAGSIIPIARAQIARGGPVTITDKAMTRYFMTITEAAQLVLQAGAMGQTGAIYVLEMGTPVKIMELLHSLIRLSGFEPDVDIPIVEIGVRPGEKVNEELMLEAEKDSLTLTTHDKIYMLRTPPPERYGFEAAVNALLTAAREEPDAVIGILKEMLPNFRHREG